MVGFIEVLVILATVVIIALGLLIRGHRTRTAKPSELDDFKGGSKRASHQDLPGVKRGSSLDSWSLDQNRVERWELCESSTVVGAKSQVAGPGSTKTLALIL